MAQATTIITMPAIYSRSTNSPIDATSTLPVYDAEGEVKWGTIDDYVNDPVSTAYKGQQIAVEENGEQTIYVIDDAVSLGGSAKYHKLAAGGSEKTQWGSF